MFSVLYFKTFRVSKLQKILSWLQANRKIRNQLPVTSLNIVQPPVSQKKSSGNGGPLYQGVDITKDIK
jgi:hypothetical protein